MQVVFLDTSALAKRCLDEIGSEWVTDLFERGRNTFIYIAELSPVELVSAVTRRFHINAVTIQKGKEILNDFDAHLRSELIVLDLDSDLISEAQALVRRHRLRAYDAVQLATAERLNRLELKQGLPGVIFVSADAELLRAAVANGLDTVNPQDYK